MTSLFQQQCDRLTQAVLLRRSHQSEPKPQLYLCQVRERVRDKDSAYVILSEDFQIARTVICGGNAGFSNPDTFRGVARGCGLPFRCEAMPSVVPIDLDSMEIFS